MDLVRYEIDCTGLSAGEREALTQRINQQTETGCTDSSDFTKAYFSLKEGVSPDSLQIPPCCHLRLCRHT